MAGLLHRADSPPTVTCVACTRPRPATSVELRHLADAAVWLCKDAKDCRANWPREEAA
jgi:hypothetical protein